MNRAFEEARRKILEAAETGATDLRLRDRELLMELPAEIGQLNSLQVLDLYNTQVSELPSEIGKLSSLLMLDLDRTQVSTLPSEIGKLSSLQGLFLGSTQVSTLPSEIGQLSSLQTLYLMNSQVSSLPAEIGQLSSLETLDLRNTPLTSLPPELGALDDRLELRLDNTQLPEPFPELIARGTPAVLAYLRSLADGAPQYEAKVLLVGEGNVGKTSLVAAMCAQPFVENRPTTHGIQLDQLSVPHPELDQALTLNTWDFGGQEVYRVTHQFFFSRRSLYLLVWRARRTGRKRGRGLAGADSPQSRR